MNPIATIRAGTAAPAAASLTLPGECSGDQLSQPAGLTRAQVRTLNALLPAAGALASLNVTAPRVGSLTGANGVGSGQFSPSTGCSTVSSGSFAPSITGSGLAGPIGFTNFTSLSAANTPYTLVTAGQAGAVGTVAPQLFLVPDYTTSQFAIPAGAAAVRIVNLSPGSSPLSLFNNVNGAAAALNSGLTNVGYGFNPALNNYVTVPVSSLGTLSLRNTTSPNQDLALSATSNPGTASFQPGGTYTVYGYGQAGSATQPLSAAVARDNQFL